MAWAVPLYSKSRINKAGDTLVQDEVPITELVQAIEVIDNWRSAHSFPLNTFQVTLRRKARAVDTGALVAQRLKRLSSIELKLRLLPGKLAQMQDIGGCRAVVRSVPKVYELVDSYANSGLKHELRDHDDYIAHPKASGYRGVHLIYRYFSDKQTTYNGLQIEIQMRSQLQHAWATAVETVGTFLKQALKSNLGEGDWLRFFALMGTAIAIKERSPEVPDTPATRKELLPELRALASKLQVEQRLEAYGSALKTVESAPAQAQFYLLVLDPVAHKVDITGYRKDQLKKAQEDYLLTEQRAETQGFRSDAVLVSVDSLSALHRAYPNYFLDTRIFLEEVRRATR